MGHDGSARRTSAPARGDEPSARGDEPSARGGGAPAPRDAAPAAERASVSGDEAALVFARAAELDRHDLPAMARLDVDAVLEAAAAAGISAGAVRRALAELEAGALTAEDRGDAWLGPRRASVQRFVPGPPERARAELHGWLRRQLLQCLRDRGNRTVWVPREGVAASMAKAFDFQRRLVLDGTREVSVSVVAEPGDDDPGMDDPGHDNKVLVCIDADLGGARRGWLALAVAGGVTGVAGVVGGVVGAVAGEPVALLAVPLGGGVAAGGLTAARAGYRRAVRATAQRLEGILDRLESPGRSATGAQRGRWRSR